ncbi:Hypothetical_protein [Hexamita inflata]|uniref:Hypothetical_protein n=1 Tax=Hexamita inflata TaxID=28002 RepID=A0AA86UYV5_9EUKA|nr:Hypothetical protein HINF_LOCUS65160 [Hexamita inflata]
MQTTNLLDFTLQPVGIKPYVWNKMTDRFTYDYCEYNLIMKSLSHSKDMIQFYQSYIKPNQSMKSLLQSINPTGKVQELYAYFDVFSLALQNVLGNFDISTYFQNTLKSDNLYNLYKQFRFCDSENNLPTIQYLTKCFQSLEINSQQMNKIFDINQFPTQYYLETISKIIKQLDREWEFASATHVLFINKNFDQKLMYQFLQSNKAPVSYKIYIQESELHHVFQVRRIISQYSKIIDQIEVIISYIKTYISSVDENFYLVAIISILYYLLHKEPIILLHFFNSIELQLKEQFLLFFDIASNQKQFKVSSWKLLSKLQKSTQVQNYVEQILVQFLDVNSLSILYYKPLYTNWEGQTIQILQEWEMNYNIQVNPIFLIELTLQQQTENIAVLIMIVVALRQNLLIACSVMEAELAQIPLQKRYLIIKQKIHESKENDRIQKCIECMYKIHRQIYKALTSTKQCHPVLISKCINTFTFYNSINFELMSKKSQEFLSDIRTSPCCKIQICIKDCFYKWQVNQIQYKDLESGISKMTECQIENITPSRQYTLELLFNNAFMSDTVEPLLQLVYSSSSNIKAQLKPNKLEWINFITANFNHFGQNEQTNNLVVSVYMLIYKLGYHSAALFKHLVKEFPEHTVQILTMVIRAVIHYELFQEQSKLNGRFEELKNETNPATNFQALDRNQKYVAYVAKNQKYFGEPDAKELFHTLPTFLDRCAINSLASFFEIDREQDQAETIAFLKEVTKKETDQEAVEHFILDLLRYPALMTVFNTIDLDKPGWKTEHVVLKLRIDGLAAGDVSETEFLKYAKKHRFVAKLAIDVAYNCLLAPKKLDQFAHVVCLLAKHSIGEEATKQVLAKDFKLAEVPGVPELVQSLKAQEELHTVVQKPDAPPKKEVNAKSAKEEKQPEAQTFEKMMDAIASDTNCSQQACEDYARIAVLQGLTFKDIARHAQLPSFPALLKIVLAVVLQTEYERMDKGLLPEKYRCLPLFQLLWSDFATSEEYLDNLKAARFGHHHEEDADPGQLHNHVDAFAVATVRRFFGASPKEIQKAGQRLHAVFKKDSELQSVAHLLSDELQLQVAMNAFSHLELDNSAFKAGCTMLESRLAKYLGQQLGLDEFAGLVSRPLTAAPVLDIVYKLTFAASLDGKLFLEVKSALVKAGCLNNDVVLAKMKEQVAANQTYGAMALVKKLAKFSKPGQPPKKAKQSTISREVSMKSEMQPENRLEESSQPVQSEPQKDTQQPEEIQIQSSTQDMQQSKPEVQEQRDDAQKEYLSADIKQDRVRKDVQNDQVKVKSSKKQKDKQKRIKINSNSKEEETLTNPVSLSDLNEYVQNVQEYFRINIINNTKDYDEISDQSQDNRLQPQFNDIKITIDPIKLFNHQKEQYIDQFEQLLPFGPEWTHLLNQAQTDIECSYLLSNAEYTIQQIENQLNTKRINIFQRSPIINIVQNGSMQLQQLQVVIKSKYAQEVVCILNDANIMK